MFKRDFPENYDSFPIYLNEPDWMRVYFWFEKKNILKDRLNLSSTEKRSSYGSVLFFFTLKCHISVLLSDSLLNLGAKVEQNGNMALEGNYMGEYQFIISNHFDKRFIMLDCDLPQSSKLYSQLLDDVKSYIFMTESKLFEIRKNKYTLLRDMADESFLSRYSKLYI